MKANKISLAFSVLLLCSTMATMTFASVNDDQVTSQKIKEADGISGQNTNSGSGVKTGHIQDGAVTDAKIAGPISASKISSAGLNADTVDGLHGTDLAPAVHTHPQSQVTGLESALVGKSDVTHNHDVLYQQKYGKVAVVAQTGGDYTDPISAMNALATWCGTPSATNPCLLKIMPGIYYIGTNTLQMQQYVDIAGSGESSTKISGSISHSGYIGVIKGASNAEIRFLTVENAGGMSYPCAIYNDMASPKITNVTVIATGGSHNSGMHNFNNSSPLMTNVTVIVSGAGVSYGVLNETSCSPTMVNVTIKASNSLTSYGIYQFGSILTINNSMVTTSSTGGGSKGIVIADSGFADISHVTIGSSGGSQNYAIDVVDTASTIKVDHSRLKGTSAAIRNFGQAFVGNTRIEDLVTTVPPGITKCIGSYDGNYDPIICP